MKLYTKQGDDGSTGLFGGARVLKNDARVEAYGTADETNAAIGLAIACGGDGETAKWLQQVQSDLFVLGGELATPDGESSRVRIDKEQAEQLERWIDACEAEVAPLKQFVLPGGCEMSARLHVARTVCRRAERAVVALGQHQNVSPDVVIYLNRLSDLLFALSRRANHRCGQADVTWSAPKA